MAGTGVGKFSSTASNNTSNLTVNFAENMAPSNVNNAARELMGHMRDMYEQLGDGYFEFGDGDGVYTVTRGDADTITITGTGDTTAVYFAGRKIRITDGGANVVEGTIASSSHSSTTLTVNLTGITLASGTPTKVELGIDTAAFGGKIILDDDGDTFIEAPTDDTIDIHIAGAKDFVFTANTFTAESGSTIAAQALTATSVTVTTAIDINGVADALILDADADTTISAPTDDQIDIEIAGADDFRFIANHFNVLSGSNVTFATDSIAYFGDGNNLQISSDGTNALIKESGGSGNLVLAGQTVRLMNAANNEIMLEATNDAGVDIRHNNVTKLVTTATGIDVTGTVTSDGASLDGAVVINDSSADVNFRVESNGNDNMFNVQGADRVGIAGIADLGIGLHIREADSGASVAGYADALVLEGATDSGMTICSGASNDGSINFADSGATDVGRITYNHNSNHMHFNTNSAERLRISDGGKVGISEASPDVSDGGLCINQNANDGNIISFKSSDIAHGTTGTAETDTFAFFRKHSATEGGISLTALSEAAETIKLNANPTTVLTDQNASTVGTHTIGVSKKNGTGSGSTDATSNLLSIANHTNTRFHFRGDGNFYADAGSNTFDEFEDAHLVRAYDLSHGRGVINSKFDKFVSYNHEKLAELDLVGRESDGTPNHFVSVTGFQRLHNGAIWQQYEKTERLANAMYELAKAAVGEEKANEILEQNEIKLLN